MNTLSGNDWCQLNNDRLAWEPQDHLVQKQIEVNGVGTSKEAFCCENEDNKKKKETFCIISLPCVCVLRGAKKSLDSWNYRLRQVICPIPWLTWIVKVCSIGMSNDVISSLSLQLGNKNKNRSLLKKSKHSLLTIAPFGWADSFHLATLCSPSINAPKLRCESALSPMSLSNHDSLNLCTKSLLFHNTFIFFLFFRPGGRTTRDWSPASP